MSANGLPHCTEIAPLLVFYACDEVEPQEREQIDAHLAVCASCAAQLREEQEMQSALVSAFQPADQLDPSGTLLAQCRSELSELLDDLSAPRLRERWSPFGWARQWMALRPAWSAAVLVVAGLVVGTQVALWIPSRDGNFGGQAMNVKAAALTNEDLSRMAVAGVNFPTAADSAGTVQLQVRTEQPIVLSGSVDDVDVRRVLTYVVTNGERFDPGVRLDCLDVLKTRTGEKDVRHALLAAARKDQNAAVRVEAVNLLVRSLEGEGAAELADPGDAPEIAGAQIPTDPSVNRVIRALEGLQHRDPNRYVRLRSAAALRQIGPRETQ